ncbi:MAG TPA: HAD hydrolase-like protein, partial [Holophaga sp.]|nr:HAD hydrolase-like protein [Holophaga sp.]
MACRALVFDMDGLLFDTERLAAETWAEAARELGFELDEPTLRGAVGLDHVLSRAYYADLFQGRFPYDQVEDLHRELFRIRIVERGVPRKQGLEALLEEAGRLGLR